MADPWYKIPAQRWQERRAGRRIWTDSQKGKLYKAERLFRRKFEGQFTVFNTLQEAQAYANDFLKSPWVALRFGAQKPVSVEEFSEYCTFCDSNQMLRRIRLSPGWGFNEIVLLHELAHILQPDSVGQPHGRFFARNLLEMIGHTLGPGAKRAFKKMYVDHRVKSTPRPEYSDEAKANMRAQGLKRAKQLGWI